MTTPRPHLSLPRLLLGATILPLCSLSALAEKPGSAAATAASTQQARPKPYTLYMGADIDVQLDKEFARIMDVSGGNFVILKRKEKVLIPLDQGKISFRINKNLKLTDRRATLGALKIERAYTPENDPFRKWAGVQSDAQAALQLRQDNAAQQLMYASGNKGAVIPGAPAASGGVTEAQAAASYSSVQASASSDMGSGNEYSRRIQEELAKELYDAVAVEFEISSDIPLETPYLILVSEFREKDKPKMLGTWVYAKALEPVNSTPRKIFFKQGGLPPGFILEKTQVHLYDAGKELATSASSKRVDLTKEEAFQYLLIQYLATNKGADKPASHAFGRVPPALAEKLTLEQLKTKIHVEVNKEGVPGIVYLDPLCTQKAPEEIQQAVAELRFTPALEKGKAVVSLVAFRLNELSL